MTRLRPLLQALYVLALIASIGTFAYAGSTGRYWLALPIIAIFCCVGAVNVWHMWRKNQGR